MKEVPEEEAESDEASGAEETAQQSEDAGATIEESQAETEGAQATEGADAPADEAADPVENDGSEEQPS